ncbi:MAG: helix-turn-helix domain-containing protein [Pseudomonadales bacterium]|nr:helix-turn-helix domain-containing protein [Pseudomonadales bacterium]
MSQAVNQHFGRFNDYINKLRVAAFLERYTEQSNVGVLAQQVGFNSRSAFYRAFKTETGTIPSKYAL